MPRSLQHVQSSVAPTPWSHHVPFCGHGPGSAVIFLSRGIKVFLRQSQQVSVNQAALTSTGVLYGSGVCFA